MLRSLKEYWQSASIYNLQRGKDFFTKLCFGEYNICEYKIVLFMILALYSTYVLRCLISVGRGFNNFKK